MPNLDDRNRHLASVFFSGAVANDSTENTFSIDMSIYDPGFTFIVSTLDINLGTAQIIPQESDVFDSGFTNVDDSKIIGAPLPTAISNASDFKKDFTALTFGLVSTKRFVRIQIVAAATGNPFNVSIIGNGFVELQPSVIGEGEEILAD